MNNTNGTSPKPSPSKQQVVARRVQRIFDLALKAPPITDPDPGNAVPFFIRKDIYRYRLAFYFGLLCLSVLILTTPRTYLYDPIDETFRFEHFTTGLIFLFFVILSHYSVTGSDPGYLPAAMAIQIGEEQALHQMEVESSSKPPSRSRIPQQPSLTSMTTAEVIISSPKSVKVNTKQKKFDVVDDVEQQQQQQPRKRRSTTGEDEEDDGVEDDDLESSRLILPLDRDDDGEDNQVGVDSDDEPNEDLDASISGIPTQKIPIRARFCRKSRLVVAMYDHHCQVLNTTIGERNRARFWFLLLWSTCGVCWLISVVHSGFRNSSPSVNAWLERNGQALVSAIICWILLAICGGLFIFHTFLMLGNVTTYEFMRADKVSYLINTKDFDLPFSLGIKENLRFYFTSDSLVLSLINRILGRQTEWKPHLWVKPSARNIERNSTDVWKNCWENRYWSCC